MEIPQLGPGKVPTGSGLDHDVLQPGLGQGVAETSENPSTLNSLLGPGEVSSDVVIL